MNIKIIMFSVLVALSNHSSADWFDGWNNADTQGSGASNASGWGTGSGDGSGSGKANASGWGAGKGDADGEVDFALKFKGKGHTNMDTKMSGEGKTDFAGNAIAENTASGNSTGQFIGSGKGSNNNGYRGNPWDNGYAMPQQSMYPLVHPSYQPMPYSPYMSMAPQMVPYGYYPSYGMGSGMPYIPAMPAPPQAPSFKEVLDKQKTIRQQMQKQMIQGKATQKSSVNTDDAKKSSSK